MISSIDSSQIRKILVFTLSNIGDAVLNTPVVSALKEHYPESYLCVLISPKSAAIFSGSKMIDEMIIFDKQSSWLQKLKLVHELREKKFDLIVDLRNSALPFFIGAKYRTPYLVDRSASSMRQRHLDQVRFLVSNGSGQNRFDFYSGAEKKSAFQKLKQKLPEAQEKNFIVLAPGAGGSLKRWTISGFSHVMNYFLARGKTVVLLGWDLERELGAELNRSASKPIVNLIGALTLRESAGLMSEASLVVANDSAVMHLAYELNRPTVSIFGPTDYRKYAQTGENRRMIRLDLECSPCGLAQCRLERRICLDDLPATSVIEACEELLNHAAH